LGFYSPTSPINDLYDAQTEASVREFQQYYGLVINGIAESATLNEIKTILNSPFQLGKENEGTIQLKKDLAKLGFEISNNPTKLYGSKTERTVREFQEFYGLAVNGIADSVTLTKISQLIKDTHYTNYNYSLEDAVEIQMNRSPQTDI